MSIHFRFAQQTDSLLVFNWRNEESIRLSSHNQDLISFDEHGKWFATRINKIQTEPILIFSKDGSEVGYTRLDILDFFNKVYEVSIAVSSEWQNKGFGPMMLDTTLGIARTSFAAGEVIATVRESNPRSLKLFVSSGFNVFETQAGFIKLRLSLLK